MGQGPEAELQPGDLAAEAPLKKATERGIGPDAEWASRGHNPPQPGDVLCKRHMYVCPSTPTAFICNTDSEPVTGVDPLGLVAAPGRGGQMLQLSR